MPQRYPRSRFEVHRGRVAHCSKIIPAIGGDTVWASGTAVYDSLPRALQLYLEELQAIHSFEHSGWPAYFENLKDGDSLYRKARNDHRPVVHPVVQTHPVTGGGNLLRGPEFHRPHQGTFPPGE